MQRGFLALAGGSMKERIGWWRGIIVAIVVAVATAAVVIPTAWVLQRYDSKEVAAAADHGAPSPAAVEAAAPAQNASSLAPPPAIPSTVPPTAPPVSVAEQTQAPATKASGRAAAGATTVSFVVADAVLHVGKTTNVNVSGTGIENDRVSSLTITNADGVVLASAAAPDCATAPAFPWSQSFPITFPVVEATEIRVRMTTCAGGSLTATSLVDIQP